MVREYEISSGISWRPMRVLERNFPVFSNKEERKREDQQ